MSPRVRTGVASILLAAAMAPIAWSQTAAIDDVEALLMEGKLADAEAQLRAELRADASDDQSRLALGVVQTLRGVERLMQGLYRHGLDPRWQTELPFLRLPVPKNPDPEPLTNEAFRKLMAEFADDLAKVEATLAEVKSAEVKLPVRPGLYRLDFDGDGQATEKESLWRIFFRLTGSTVRLEQAGQFVIAMDKGDVHWLRGYCRLLSAMCEMQLAYDTQELHDHAAQMFFPTAKVRYAFATPPGDEEEWDWILDGIAFIHLLHLPVAEPERMKTAHGHLLAVIEQSRLSFAALGAETDDDREWIPNAQQKSIAFPRAAITPDMVEDWHAVLEELETILNGEKLVPFWRGKTGKGVNVKRVFYEPTTFDLVLWLQGSAAGPYLEEGEVTRPDFWRRIQQGFRGQFFWFAIWVN